MHFTQKLLEANLPDKDVRSAFRLVIEGTKMVAEKGWLLVQLGG